METPIHNNRAAVNIGQGKFMYTSNPDEPAIVFIHFLALKKDANLNRLSEVMGTDSFQLGWAPGSLFMCRMNYATKRHAQEHIPAIKTWAADTVCQPGHAALQRKTFVMVEFCLPLDDIHTVADAIINSYTA